MAMVIRKLKKYDNQTTAIQGISTILGYTVFSVLWHQLVTRRPDRDRIPHPQGEEAPVVRRQEIRFGLHEALDPPSEGHEQEGHEHDEVAWADGPAAVPVAATGHEHQPAEREAGHEEAPVADSGAAEQVADRRGGQGSEA